MENLREKLGLVSHPEGGAYRELAKSSREVDVVGGQGRRSAVTHIYFHLSEGEVSRFHKVASDEIWHLYEGDGVILYQWEEGSGKVESVRLGTGDALHCHLIPAGIWQAAEPVGESVLVGCTVAPGFEFEDFTLIDSDGPEAREIRRIDPGLEKFL